MADTNNVSLIQQMVNPDAGSQQLQIQQRQKMADLLMQQAMTQQPSGEMIGGHYVPRSWTQGLAQVLQGYGAGKMNDANVKAQSELNHANAEALKPSFDSLYGSGNAGSPAGSFAGGQVGSSAAGSAGIPDAPADPVARLKAQAKAALLMGNKELSDKLLENALTLTNEQRNMIAMGQDPRLMGQLGIAEARKKGIIELQPGTTALDLSTGQERFQPKVGEGISLNNGVASQVPGYAVANAGIQGTQTQAQEKAKADLDMVTINTPNGPMMVTRSQAAQMAGGHTPQENIQFNQGNSQMDFRGMTPNQVVAMAEGIKDPKEKANFLSTIGKWANQPKQQGIALETPEGKAYKEGQAKSASDYKTSLDSRVTQGADLNMRLQESADALSNFKSGGGKETRAQLAQIAQGMQLPENVVNGIAGGNLAAMQVFQKMAVSQAMETLKQTMATQSGSAGRMTQSEFQNFLKVNPNLSTDPNAIKKLFDFTNKVYRRDLDEQQAHTSYVENGGNPAQFPAYWAQEITKRGYTNPDMKVTPGANMGNKQVDDLLKKYGG